jgi:CDP-paratose 2-epimerase
VGVEVTVLDNLPPVDTLNDADKTHDTSRHNWKYLAEHHPNVERARADIRDAKRMESIVRGHDGIVHTAVQVAMTSSIQKPLMDFSMNAAGAFNVLKAA